jgi:hypothetical protein
MFVERPTGTFELRRGFRLTPGQQVLMMEDVVTTGLSSREAMKAIAQAGGEVIAAASLVDRSNGTADLGVPFFPLIRLDVPSYAADALPPELAAIPGDQAGQPGAHDEPPSPRREYRPCRDRAQCARERLSRSGARGAEIARRLGGDGITAHLREDRRHITDDDIARLAAELTIPLNLEMAATDEMLAIALRHRPHAACIVPERREERTTEGGLDAAGLHNLLAPMVSELKGANIRVSRCSSNPIRADRSGDPAGRAGRRIAHRALLRAGG